MTSTNRWIYQITLPIPPDIIRFPAIYDNDRVHASKT